MLRLLNRSLLTPIRRLSNFGRNDRLINAINHEVSNHQRNKPYKLIFQISSIIIGTIVTYTTYKVAYKGERVFIPLYISKTKRPPYNFEVDSDLIQLIAEEQLLERLSLNWQIQQQFKLPIKLDDKSGKFDVWIEEKFSSLKGLEISSKGSLFKKIEKPIRVDDIFDDILEPIGGEKDKFEIPSINKKDSNYDVWFLGEITLRGNNSNEALIVFKGIFDSEHIKHARILKAHLIKTVDGKKKRTILWE